MSGAAGGVAGAVAAALDRLAPAGALGVAVSGGSDSTALLLAAHRWSTAAGRSLAVATVDHGLRAEAAAEAAAVARLAASLGHPHTTLTTGPLPPGNVNAAAREARYRLLREWASESGLSAVLLGHTLDDQAETVLMRLGRGSGVDGLSAMTEASERIGTLWLRPLLGLRRAALRDWLRSEGVAWSEDPTNADPRHLRVRVRDALASLEAAGIPAERIAGSAVRLARQRAVLDDLTRALARRSLTAGAAGEVWIERGPLCDADPEIAGRLVAAVIRAVSGAEHPPRGEPLQALVAAIRSDPPQGVALGGVLVGPARGGQILACREPAATEAAAPLGPAGALWDNRWRIGAPPGPGFTLGALGAEDASSLPDRHAPAGWEGLPHRVRRTLPAIREGARLVGVPLPGAPDPAPGWPTARNLVRERLLSSLLRP